VEMLLKLSVGSGVENMVSNPVRPIRTVPARPGQNSAGRRGPNFDLDSFDWFDIFRHHSLDTRCDTEFKLIVGSRR
jgi:hypothetical protein